MEECKMNSRFESHLIENREVRIFLSSTFSDMDAERSALVKLSHKLKMEANKRNVSLSLLDLRWGVTEEESRTGKVLSVCLNEIENSHPFFIGLLGSRYGYSPEASELKKNPDLKERYPWIEKDISDGMSITEIEIQYGVLRNQENIDAAFFIKDTPEMLPDDDEKLTALKSKIRGQKCFPVSNYKSTDHLCEQVEKLVMNLLDKYFDDADNTRLGRERNVQQAYINSRHRFYVPRQEEFDRLNKFLNSDEQYLVVTGQSGIGKSALIANWLKSLEKGTNQKYNIIYHFVGNSFGGNSHNDVLQHISDELLYLYEGLEIKMDNDESIEKKAQRYLTEAVQKGDKPILIVIDGINQIDDQNQSKLLNWLPQSTHKVKYLFSTLEDDETMQTFIRREYPVYTVMPLKERNKFIIDYLSLVGKKLDGDQIERILKNRITENTLVLKTLLDELICFGSYEHLNERIGFYLAATSIPEFFNRMLQRLENDYEGARRLLSLIAVSEHGLSEDELIAITGMRQMDFHLFYCAISSHLINRGGLLVFAHQYITDAIWTRYSLQNITDSQPYREEIIGFFSKKEISNRNRQISELAYQYYSVNDCENLYRVILSFEAFEYFDSTTMGKALLASYWRKLLQDNTSKYQLRDYLDLPIEEIPIKNLPYLGIGIFAHDYFRDIQVSYECNQSFLLIAQESNEDLSDEIGAAFNNIGLLCIERDDYPNALKYYNEALALDKKSHKTESLLTASIYINIGSANSHLGDYSKALELYGLALNIYNQKKKVGPSISHLYSAIGDVYDLKGDYPNALRFFSGALEIREKWLGYDDIMTADSYVSLGLVYCHLKEYAKALVYYRKALEIQVKVLGEDHPDIAKTFNGIGGVYENKNDYVTALKYFEKARDLFKKHHIENIVFAGINNNIGGAYYKLGDFKKAHEYFNEALMIRERVLGPDHPDTATSYNNISLIYSELGDHQKALEYYLKAMTVYEKNFGLEHPSTITSYNNVASVYDDLRDYSNALKYFFKVLNYKKKVLGRHHLETATIYNFIGLEYNNLGDYPKALEYVEKAMNIREKELGDNHLETASSYKNVSFCYYRMKKYSIALEYLKKAYEIRKLKLGAGHPDTFNTLLEIMNVSSAMKKTDEKPEDV